MGRLHAQAYKVNHLSNRFTINFTFDQVRTIGACRNVITAVIITRPLYHLQYYNFNDPGYALLTTLDMTTSPGVGLETLFNLDQPAATFTTIPFHYLNILVWLLLLLLFPLVFNNMLVCIDIKWRPSI